MIVYIYVHWLGTLKQMINYDVSIIFRVRSDPFFIVLVIDAELNAFLHFFLILIV